MTEPDIYTALDLLVPAMRKKGLSIQAGTDSLAIPPGWMAERMADYLVRCLQCELLMLERRRHYDPRQEAEHGH